MQRFHPTRTRACTLPATTRRIHWTLALVSVVALLLPATAGADRITAQTPANLDRDLREVLESAGFTGTVESTLESRLGRPLNTQLADLGRLVFFDKITGFRIHTRS
jgi:hypothetical protein